MKPAVAVALSGGIDSMMAAWLLKTQGYKVTGIHFITGFEEGGQAPNFQRARRKMTQLGRQLEIPIRTLDVSAVFTKQVTDYFVQTYLTGKTPNPCLRCNPTIKFGAVLDFARKCGIGRLATGHYAQTARIGERVHLFKGADESKDQSYFLALLTQKQLASAVFPLGTQTKTAVQAQAGRLGLRPADRRESQDICFITNNDYGDFIERRTKKCFQPGPIVDLSGRQLGQHSGLHRFTIGQRRKINCPGPAAYYVIDLDPARNLLVVGLKQDLMSRRFRVDHINWIGGSPPSPVAVTVRVRYRSRAVPATLFPLSPSSGRVVLDSPHMAITPGQGAVFYADDEVLGGGSISEVMRL
jgi:tRNA-specific 2-thiouridylase